MEDAPKTWGTVADFAACSVLLENYSQWLKAYCRAFGVAYVDFRQDFLTVEGQVRRELFSDGLHPNAQGHALMARRLMESGVLK